MSVIEHQISIKKVNNEWKVVHSQDQSESSVHAKKGGRISVTADGTDVYFQFMDEGLFGNFTHKLRNGKTVGLNIRNAAKAGEHPYALFV